jgi:heme/copper-type cytochrome/quinol oxidase subunit 3
MAEKLESGEFVPQRDNTKLAMWFFLGSEIVFFTMLILSYVFLRLANPSAYVADFRSHLSIPLIGVNTFILISSSFMVVWALEGIREGKPDKLRNRLIGVIVLGLLFLGGQAFEWATLFRDGIGLKDTFGTPFFTVTGIHGTHVFVGVIWAIFLLVSASRGAFTQKEHQGVEIFGLYWHFVDIVWVVLFTLFYLI